MIHISTVDKFFIPLRPPPMVNNWPILDTTATLDLVTFIMIIFVLMDQTRVIFDRVRNRRNYFEIAAFLNCDKRLSTRVGNSNDIKT